jgi:sugar phosphate isomerase/epimerase
LRVTNSIADRVSVCSWSLQPQSPAELAEKLKTIGIPRTQLAFDPLRRGGAWTDGVAKLADLGIGVSSAMFEAVGEDYSTLDSIRQTGGVVPDATWPDTFENFRVMVPMARQAGLTQVTFHAGFLPHDPADPDYAKLSRRLVQVADLFADHGLTCCLETGQEEAATLNAFLADLDRPNVGVNFDPANLVLYDKGDPIAALETLLPRVVSCHVKDATKTRVPGTWGAEVVVGTGDVDWRAFFATLDRAGFQGTLAIEREAGDQRVADIQVAHAFVRGLLGY